MDRINFKNRVSGESSAAGGFPAVGDWRTRRAAKRGKVVVKVNPRFSSCECRNCGYTDKLNRERERFICLACGHIDHADIGAAKTLKDRAIEVIQSIVLGDFQEQEPRGSKRPKQRKEISARPRGKRVEPGNLSNQDIKAAMS